MQLVHAGLDRKIDLRRTANGAEAVVPPVLFAVAVALAVSAGMEPIQSFRFIWSAFIFSEPSRGWFFSA